MSVRVTSRYGCYSPYGYLEGGKALFDTSGERNTKEIEIQVDVGRGRRGTR